MPSDKNSSNDITISQKYLEKIVKMQQDQEGARQQEYELLTTQLAQMNVFLGQLISVSGSGSTVAATKKYIPFQTGSQQAGQLLIKPANQDSYPTSVDVYKINNNRVVPHMTLINDGPGNIFFISAYANDVFSTEEGHLNVNDQRELFNVYEIRLRSTLPLTTFRLIEGIFRTGSFAPNTIANVEIRPSKQPNQLEKTFAAVFDISLPTVDMTSPIVQSFPVLNINPSVQAPLPPGQTAAFTDNSTGIPMPFTIQEGFIAEAFSFLDNMSTDHTIRNWVELIPGTFTLINTQTVSDRGALFNLQLNLGAQFSTRVFDSDGAPAGGRKSLFTITNDDPFNNMIGSALAVAMLIRLR